MCVYESHTKPDEALCSAASVLDDSLPFLEPVADGSREGGLEVHSSLDVNLYNQLVNSNDVEPPEDVSLTGW